MPFLKIAVPLLLLLFLGVSLRLSPKEAPGPDAAPAVGPVSQKTAVSETIGNAPPSPALADTDRDGLKNWEEALLGTDPNNSDTDGDGITDDYETMREQNVIASEEARGVQQKPSIWIPAFQPPPAKPLTRTIGKGETAQGTRQAEPTESRAPKSTGAPSHGGAQTEPTEISERAALQEYGNKVGRILKTSVNAQEETEAFSLFLTSQGGHKSAKTRIAEIAEAYEDRAERLAALAPPPETSALHGAFTTRIKTQAAAVRQITSFAAATEVPLPEWQRYSAAVAASGAAFMDLALFFKKQAISWSAEEDGAVFTIPEF